MARAEDDQWDIVTGVGYTALVVAAWRALHTAGPRPPDAAKCPPTCATTGRFP